MKTKVFFFLLLAMSVNVPEVHAQLSNPPSTCDQLDASADERAACIEAEITFEQIDALQGVINDSRQSAIPKLMLDTNQARLNKLYDEYRALERQIPGAFYHARQSH